VPAFDRLRRLAQAAVADGITPGLVVLAGAAGRNVFHDAFGHRQVDPAPLPATPDTVYDLASLTKALVTSLLAAQGVGQGLLDLGEDVAPGGGRPLGARSLLCHSAGLAAHRPFHEEALRLPPSQRRARVVALAAAEPPQDDPPRRAIYSDLGFILLGDWLERRLGARLDRLADERLFAPLGLAGLRFAPAGVPAPFAGRPVAPTQRCPVRGRLLEGEVDDLNCWAMDGVAGHAGLFGDAAAVATLAHALCAAWRDAAPAGGAPLVPGPVLRDFWRPQPDALPGSVWRLGWDGPSPSGSLAGDRISRRAVGHLAFTGCSLWIDPERETFVLVLSNRVHPAARQDPRFGTLRRALNDAALEGAGYSAD
jgi:serine-type D-Ala-D-Ala carboxypeptidase